MEEGATFLLPPPGLYYLRALGVFDGAQAALWVELHADGEWLTGFNLIDRKVVS